MSWSYATNIDLDILSGKNFEVLKINKKMKREIIWMIFF